MGTKLSKASPAPVLNEGFAAIESHSPTKIFMHPKFLSFSIRVPLYFDILRQKIEMRVLDWFEYSSEGVSSVRSLYASKTV